MALRLNNNVTTLFSNRALGTNIGKSQQSQERLASGSRINHSGDDSAGLAVSEKNKATLRGLSQAQKNIQDAFGFVNTADGALNEIDNLISRMRQLAVQTSTDTLSSTERSFVDKEVQHLMSEVDRIAASTVYNGVRLLDGSSKKLDFQMSLTFEFFIF